MQRASFVPIMCCLAVFSFGMTTGLQAQQKKRNELKTVKSEAFPEVVTEGAALWTPQTLLYLDGVADSTFSGSDFGSKYL